MTDPKPTDPGESDPYSTYLDARDQFIAARLDQIPDWVRDLVLKLSADVRRWYDTFWAIRRDASAVPVLPAVDLDPREPDLPQWAQLKLAELRVQVVLATKFGAAHAPVEDDTVAYVIHPDGGELALLPDVEVHLAIDGGEVGVSRDADGGLMLDAGPATLQVWMNSPHTAHVTLVKPPA